MFPSGDRKQSQEMNPVFSVDKQRGGLVTREFFCVVFRHICSLVKKPENASSRKQQHVTSFLCEEALPSR